MSCSRSTLNNSIFRYRVNASSYVGNAGGFYAIARIVKWGLTGVAAPPLVPFHHSLKCNLDSYESLYSLYVILNVFGVVHEVNFPAAALVDEALQSIVYSINTGNNA